jgi:hypothetical protein
VGLHTKGSSGPRQAGAPAEPPVPGTPAAPSGTPPPAPPNDAPAWPPLDEPAVPPVALASVPPLDSSLVLDELQLALEPIARTSIPRSRVREAKHAMIAFYAKRRTSLSWKRAGRGRTPRRCVWWCERAERTCEQWEQSGAGESGLSATRAGAAFLRSVRETDRDVGSARARSSPLAGDARGRGLHGVGCERFSSQPLPARRGRGSPDPGHGLRRGHQPGQSSALCGSQARRRRSAQLPVTHSRVLARGARKSGFSGSSNARISPSSLRAAMRRPAASRGGRSSGWSRLMALRQFLQDLEKIGVCRYMNAYF